MKNLDKYRKPAKNPSTHVTSVNISKDQKEFLDRENLNLSEIIRDYLDDLMRKTKAG